MNISTSPDTQLSYRTIWISDFHLGTQRARADMLLKFLTVTNSRKLYLVGDIVDNWSLKKRWYWDQTHSDIIQRILYKATKGTKVIYIPGNHDEHFRDFAGANFGQVSVRRNDIHKCLNGKSLLVMHGDEFDGIVKNARWLAYLGDNAYELAMSLNTLINKTRRFFGLRYWSLSAYLKYKVKQAVEFMSNFEKEMVGEARRRNADGVVCGHVHTPQMRIIDGIEYYNDGDWVESCSALVEHLDGRMELIHWADHMSDLTKPEEPVADALSVDN